MTERYIALAEPERIFEQSGEEVVSHLVLPNGVDLERISLNVSKLSSLGRLAGSKQLHLCITAGEVTDYDVSGSSIHADGSAVLTGAVKAPKRDLANFTYDDGDHPLRTLISRDGPRSPRFETNKLHKQMYKADRLALYLSKTAIEESIKENDHKYQKGLVDEKAWAKYLDMGIKAGIKSAAFERFTAKRETATLFEIVRSLAFRATFIAELGQGQRFLPSVFLGVWGLTGVAHLGRVLSREEELGSFNFSALGDVRFDRAIGVQVGASLGSLVKVKK